MNFAKRIMTVVRMLMTRACSMGVPTQPPQDTDPRVKLRLESLYMSRGLLLGSDAPQARLVSLMLSGSSDAEMKGTLVLDPNDCTLNPFGDPQGCTKIASRRIEVDVVRMRLADPTPLMRRYYEVRGKGLPQTLAMIVQGRLAKGGLERCYLVLGNELMPLFIDDGV